MELGFLLLTLVNMFEESTIAITKTIPPDITSAREITPIHEKITDKNLQIHLVHCIINRLEKKKYL